MTIRTIVAAAAVALVLTGCGRDDSASPAETVPGLSSILERVDQAVAQERYDLARKRLGDLMETVELAHENGVIDDAEAERLLAAAAALEVVLPKAILPPTGSPAVTPTPTGSSHTGGSDDKQPGDKKPGNKKHPGSEGNRKK